MITIEYFIAALNIFVFCLFGIDKLLAKKKKWRVPELLLIILSLFFGGAGAMFGMIVFNHKTSKIKFRLLIPFSVFMNYIMSVDSFSLLRQILSFILQIIPE